MNYRHIYHAGNFADVFKHLVLISLIHTLNLKEKPCCYLETHAGMGKYDLWSLEAERTLESESGIGKLLKFRSSYPNDCPTIITQYLDIVLSLNQDLVETMTRIRHYPGSPILFHSQLRPQDRLVLSELHPLDVTVLKTLFQSEHRVAVHHQDGYGSIKAFLPPKENRGLVFIDPPFEQIEELHTIIKALMLGLKKWSNGIYTVWYPIKEHSLLGYFYQNLQLLHTHNIMDIQFSLNFKGTEKLKNNGMIIVNPPWKFEEKIKDWLPWLTKALAGEESASYKIEWIKRKD